MAEEEKKTNIKDILDSMTTLENTIMHRIVYIQVRKNAGEYISKDDKAVDEYLRYLVAATFDKKKRAACLYLIDQVSKLSFEKNKEKKQEDMN